MFPPVNVFLVGVTILSLFRATHILRLARTSVVAFASVERGIKKANTSDLERVSRDIRRRWLIGIL
jgi:hypothetical protein